MNFFDAFLAYLRSTQMAKRKKINKKMAKSPSKKERKPGKLATGIKRSIKKIINKVAFAKHQTSLKAGDAAPDFSGLDQDGKNISLSDFAGKTLVLYFYPKDDTPGCTAESCSLRDEYKFLAQKDFAVVGVSADSVKSHKKFAEKFSLPFPLLADTDMKIIKAYDVWGKKMLFGRVYDGIVRTTFIIKNKKIERVITEVDTEQHAKQVVEG